MKKILSIILTIVAIALPTSVFALDSIEFDVNFTGTTMNINIGNVRVLSDESGPITNPYTGTIANAGTTNSSETNTLIFVAPFGDPEVETFTINGVDYTAASSNVTVTEDTLAGFTSHTYSIVVPGASKYTIRGTAVATAVPHTIVWTNPGGTAIDAEDAAMQHGSAKIIAVYAPDGTPIPTESFTHPNQPYGVDANGNGWASAPKDAVVVFEFTPEYGYQLTSVKANGVALTPQTTQNQYKFTMPEANIHFAAVFTKVDDVVTTDSDSVSSGSITLGKNLAAGTTKLTVTDVDLTEEQIKNFKDFASDYDVEHYLDIDLYNIFYKGKNDSDDVWSSQIHELDKEATITIKLDDSIDVSKVVLVHNIHDDNEYEIIEVISYDTEAHTITFKTKSFSNYAIAFTNASTPASTNTNGSPNTGDNVMLYIATLGIGVVGLALVLKKRFI